MRRPIDPERARASRKESQQLRQAAVERDSQHKCVQNYAALEMGRVLRQRIVAYNNAHAACAMPSAPAANDRRIGKRHCRAPSCVRPPISVKPNQEGPRTTPFDQARTGRRRGVAAIHGVTNFEQDCRKTDKRMVNASATAILGALAQSRAAGCEGPSGRRSRKQKPVENTVSRPAPRPRCGESPRQHGCDRDAERGRTSQVPPMSSCAATQRAPGAANARATARYCPCRANTRLAWTAPIAADASAPRPSLVASPPPALSLSRNCACAEGGHGANETGGARHCDRWRAAGRCSPR